MIRRKAIKYRLRPTEDQAVLFAKTFGCVRKVYNLMLDDKIKFYNDQHKMLHNTPAQYKQDYPYLKEVDSLALANAALNLDQAYKNFFNQPKVGFPKFKAKHKTKKSYTTNNQNGTIAITNGYIKLPKVGKVKAVLHRLPSDSWNLKSATISQDPDGKYYASLLFEYDVEITPVAVSDENAIGLDYKSDGLYMDSNGFCPHPHKRFRESQTKLAKEQRKLSHRCGPRKGAKPSNNYKKQKAKVAKLQRHIANQRLDFLHKQSTMIAKSYDVVAVEELNLKAIASKKSLKNGKATMDNAYGMFKTMLKYKLEDLGKYFVIVGKYYPSSQLCSCCGNRKKLKLSERTYVCDCGMIMDRDMNAAINIKNEGLRLLAATIQ